MLLSSCATPFPDSSSLRVEPDYGPAIDFAGVWTVSFEHSGFIACADPARCSGPDLGCWLEASQDFWRQVQDAARPELIGTDMLRNGRFFLRISGRIAHNGPFGHLGLYRCQIRPLRLIAAEGL